MENKRKELKFVKTLLLCEGRTEIVCNFRLLRKI